MKAQPCYVTNGHATSGVLVQLPCILHGRQQVHFRCLVFLDMNLELNTEGVLLNINAIKNVAEIISVYTLNLLIYKKMCV